MKFGQLKPHLKNVKEDIIDFSFSSFYLMAVPLLAISIFRSSLTGWKWLYSAHLIILLICIIFLILRKRLTARFKVNILILFTSLLAVIGIVSLGLFAAGGMLFIGTSGFIAIFYKPKYSYIFPGIVAVIFLVIYFLFSQHILAYPKNAMEYLYNPFAWITYGGILILISFFCSMIIIKIVNAQRKYLDQIKESEEHFRQLFNNAPDGITIVDTSGTFLFVNDKTCELSGYSEEELIGANVLSIFSKQSLEEKPLQLDKIVEGQVLKTERKIQRKDGSEFVIEMRTNLLSANKVITFFSDITEKKANTQLLELFKKSIDSHYDGTFWLNEDNTFFYINKAGCDLLGYEHDEIVGRNIEEVNPKATSSRMNEIWRLLREKKFFTIETQNQRKDGSLFPAEITSIYVQFDNKEFICGFARDVSERKKAEKALSESEEKFRSLFENAQIGIYQTTPQGEILTANPALIQMLGFDSFEEIARRNLETDDVFVDNHREVFKQIMKRQGRIRNHESKWKRKDNEYIHVIENARSICNDAGETLYYDGFVENITERKLMEEALRQKTALLEAQLNSSIDGILVVNRDNKKLLKNQQFLKLLKIPQEVADDIDDTAQLEYVKNRTKNPIEFSRQVAYLYDHPEEIGRDIVEFTDGSILDRYSAPVRDSEGINYGRIWIFRDITESKQSELALIAAKEKAEESDRLKTSFLANMSHEIRTPMNAIIGFSDIINKPYVDAIKKERFTKIIQQSAYDLLHLIEDILDISKIEVGQLKLSESEFSLSKIMTDLYDLYHQKINALHEKSNVSIKLSLPDNLKSETIYTDGQRLKQVMTNLMDNAVKFTHKGFIEYGCYLEGNSMIAFYVKDSGIGISPDKQKIIFDRFRQADDAITEKMYGGTGLGLSIVKGIVTQFNGNIRVESLLDKGTTFLFTIPYRKSENINS